MHSYHVCPNIIVTYASTADHSEVEVNAFYDSLNELLASCKPDEVKIIMGDFDAKVGKGRDGKTVGSFGLGERNGRGQKLVDRCMGNVFIVTNASTKKALYI